MFYLEIKEKEDCTGCFACSNICPENCIIMENDTEGFWYPTIDYGKCIKCKKCIKVCPVINKSIVNNKPVAFACYNKNNKIRYESSSGGVFSVIAEKVIHNGGIVFGAGFDENFSVKHSHAQKIEEIKHFRGSKYVQSCIGETYKQAKYFLKQGKQVLFAGTPCQISGLKSFLGLEYDNLLCIDIVCHGVPSPKVWKEYVKFREKKAKSRVKKISLRSKNKGWKQYSVLFMFENNTEYCETMDKDLFMKAFLKNICLRPSCYNCKFKTLHRQSDITLADFWGIQNILPEMDDDKGTSLIFINSMKGQAVFEEIKDSLVYKEVDIEQAVRYNSLAVKSAEYNIKRYAFFKELDKLPFDLLIKKYCKDPLAVIIKKLIKRTAYTVLKRIGLLNISKK
ncbi:Coenzyme F420 hydrogenase/dehydrogenase, beta subunit C-terminal domain [Thermoclostridium stercorarium]|uniref:Coenzyme F420 hydrogenase/dehydrogenase, beta subunit C-terminal domain n=1 Tax=Thermoclostridium stercorarium TaxID=1510 RepID=UPI000AF31F1D|nr:Coenzyme F420 hydrogenase/dehydrogenase, beta subunit C-terminal domain [Thermoclostridium stercorarium]